MRKLIIAATAAVLVAACSEQKPVQQEEETATALAPGQYEASWKVSALRSVDKSTPATNLKPDATGTTTACVACCSFMPCAAAMAVPASSAYVRNGRLSMDLTCRRKGTGGEVRQSVYGSFKKDSLDSEVSTTTYLSGYGDYAMTRTFTAKRIGECPPAAATPEKKA